MAPSVRVAIGEMFGLKPGENTIGKIYAALRRIGFDLIFDTNFSADLTITEEATEFVTARAHAQSSESGKGIWQAAGHTRV